MNERKLVTHPNALALIFCDRSIVIKLCLLFDILRELAQSSSLKEV